MGILFKNIFFILKAVQAESPVKKAATPAKSRTRKAAVTKTPSPVKEIRAAKKAEPKAKSPVKKGMYCFIAVEFGL